MYVHPLSGDAGVVAELKGLEAPAGSPFAMRGISFENVTVSGGAWQCSHVQGDAAATPGACSCLATGC